MKSTTMLSQITTQEDILFAGITVKQLIIWIVGGFVILAIYICIPRAMEWSVPKGLLMLASGGTAALSTFRYANQLLIDRWVIRIRYLLRPTVMTE